MGAARNHLLGPHAGSAGGGKDARTQASAPAHASGRKDGHHRQDGGRRRTRNQQPALWNSHLLAGSEALDSEELLLGSTLRRDDRLARPDCRRKQALRRAGEESALVLARRSYELGVV